MNNMTKEELQRQLDEIKAKELEDVIGKAYPKFRELIGKTFRRKNSYSCPEKKSDYWWLYSKVIDITKDDLYLGGGINSDISDCPVLSRCRVLSFQVDKYGKISIYTENTFTHILGNEISHSVFKKAWDKVMQEVNNIEI